MIKNTNPLELDASQLNDFGKVRKAYKAQMSKVLRNRSARVALNQCYSQVCAKLFSSTLSKLQQAIISGDLETLVKMLSKDKKILNSKFNEYPVIYLAVRSGHYDIVKFLLESGCCLNFEGCASTPMHCAAYYGHYSLIPLLLMFGIPIEIKNKHKHLPIEEAANPEIERLLTIHKQSRIQKLNQALLNIEIGYPTINIKDKNDKVVVKKIVSKNYFSFCSKKGYDDAFHGTLLENLESIMKYGLRKPGETIQGKLVSVPKGHIPLGVEFQGKKNWSKAIFTSPSIYYAAHPVYSKEFIQNNDQSIWLPLVQVKVKKGAFTRHDHTLKSYTTKNEEPTELQFRVQCTDERENLIMRSQQTEAVIVVSALFIRKGFLEDNANYKEVTQLIVDSHEERMFRKLNM